MISGHSFLRTSFLYQTYFTSRASSSSLLGTYLSTPKRSLCSKSFKRPTSNSLTRSLQIQRNFSRLVSQEYAVKMRNREEEKTKELTEEEKQEWAMMQEVAAAFQYYNFSLKNSAEEFEERLYDLVKDTTEDQFLLLEVMSYVNLMEESQIEAFRKSSRFKKVDELIKNHLKQGKFNNHQLMLVNSYLKRAGGSQGTIEYAVQKTYNSMRDLPLLTIVFGLAHLESIQDQENVKKFVQKVEKVIITNHESLYKDVQLRGIFGLIILLSDPLKQYTTGSLRRDLNQKLEKLLLHQLQIKTWQVDPDTTTNLMNALAREGLLNEEVWQILFSDFQHYLSEQSVNLEHVVQLTNALAKASFTDKDFFEHVLNYLVEKGYDDEDLGQMGSERAVEFINNLAIVCPDLENLHFLVLIQNFTKKNLKNLGQVQLVKMKTALQSLENLSDKSLVESLDRGIENLNKREMASAKRSGASDEDDTSFIKNE